jgi:hypothetical protein
MDEDQTMSTWDNVVKQSKNGVEGTYQRKTTTVPAEKNYMKHTQSFKHMTSSVK